MNISGSGHHLVGWLLLGKKNKVNGAPSWPCSTMACLPCSRKMLKPRRQQMQARQTRSSLGSAAPAACQQRHRECRFLTGAAFCTPHLNSPIPTKRQKPHTHPSDIPTTPNFLRVTYFEFPLSVGHASIQGVLVFSDLVRHSTTSIHVLLVLCSR